MRARRLILGMLAGNAVGMLILILADLLVVAAPGSFLMVGIPSLALVPACIGLTASWVWRPLKLGFGAILLHSLFTTLVSLGIAVAFYHEGSICLIIVAPILYAGVLAGAFAGRTYFRHDHDRLNVCLAPFF